MNSRALWVIILLFTYIPVATTRLPAAGFIATSTPSRCFNFYLKAKHSNLAIKRCMRLIRGNAKSCVVSQGALLSCTVTQQCGFASPGESRRSLIFASHKYQVTPSVLHQWQVPLESRLWVGHLVSYPGCKTIDWFLLSQRRSIDFCFGSTRKGAFRLLLWQAPWLHCLWTVLSFFKVPLYGANLWREESKTYKITVFILHICTLCPSSLASSMLFLMQSAHDHVSTGA